MSNTVVVGVHIDGLSKTLAYEAPPDTKTGDRVTIPPFWWENPEQVPPRYGTVTGSGADLPGDGAGQVRRVLTVRHPLGEHAQVISGPSDPQSRPRRKLPSPVA